MFFTTKDENSLQERELCNDYFQITIRKLILDWYQSIFDFWDIIVLKDPLYSVEQPNDINCYFSHFEYFHKHLEIFRISLLKLQTISLKFPHYKFDTLRVTIAPYFFPFWNVILYLLWHIIRGILLKWFD